MECIVCEQEIGEDEKKIVLTKKGADGINEASTQRKSDVTAVVGSVVHEKCRQQHNNKKSIESFLKRKKETEKSETIATTKRQRLSGEERHDVCLFCSQQFPLLTSKQWRVL